jgi:hypothetical protein
MGRPSSVAARGTSSSPCTVAPQTTSQAAEDGRRADAPRLASPQDAGRPFHGHPTPTLR